MFSFGARERTSRAVPTVSALTDPVARTGLEPVFSEMKAR